MLCEFLFINFLPPTNKHNQFPINILNLYFMCMIRRILLGSNFDIVGHNFLRLKEDPIQLINRCSKCMNIPQHNAQFHILMQGSLSDKMTLRDDEVLGLWLRSFVWLRWARVTIVHDSWVGLIEFRCRVHFCLHVKLLKWFKYIDDKSIRNISYEIYSCVRIVCIYYVVQHTFCLSWQCALSQLRQVML